MTKTGNTIVMHEALERVLAAYKSGAIRPCAECYQDELGDIRNAVETALAMPARNCDVGTPKEQRVRFVTWCENHNLECEDCPLRAFRDSGDCGFAWLQMPYKGKENFNEQHQ